MLVLWAWVGGAGAEGAPLWQGAPWLCGGLSVSVCVIDSIALRHAARSIVISNSGRTFPYVEYSTRAASYSLPAIFRKAMRFPVVIVPSNCSPRSHGGSHIYCFHLLCRLPALHTITPPTSNNNRPIYVPFAGFSLRTQQGLLGLSW